MPSLARTLPAALAALLAAAPATVRAQQTPRERAALSRDAYDAGKKHYNLGEFDQAIERWKQGYEFKDDPIFLYNIAQAYRQKGDHQKAIFFYRAYIREEPRARNREDVEARIAELTKLIAASQSATESGPREPVEPTPPNPEPPPAPVAIEPTPPASPPRDAAALSPGRGLKIGGVVAGSAGALALAGGVLFLVRSSSIEGEIEDAARSGQPWSAELVDRESTGRTSEILGWVGIGAGAALVATGVTLFVLGARKDFRARHADEPTLTVLPMPVRTGIGAQLTLSL